MSEPTPPKPGQIGWHDLTVENADSLRAFYEQVFGWTSMPISMGDYDDFVLLAPDGSPVGGVCHARGENTGIPKVWMSYVVVEDLAACVERATAGGATVVHGPRAAGGGLIAIIQDPEGAHLGLYQAIPPAES
ncbi:MAG: VOC family protein [Planctomycetota bacterium]|jgi:predicted enzyme related to lactoylglutathione lyase